MFKKVATVKLTLLNFDLNSHCKFVDTEFLCSLGVWLLIYEIKAVFVVRRCIIVSKWSFLTGSITSLFCHVYWFENFGY